MSCCHFSSANKNRGGNMKKTSERPKIKEKVIEEKTK